MYHCQGLRLNLNRADCASPNPWYTRDWMKTYSEVNTDYIIPT